MNPKKNVVQIRLTEMEREAWATAAGGKGRLSDWIRKVCNEAANPAGLSGPGGVATSGGSEAEPPPRKPRQTSSPSKQCERWMHHRPGTYCGTCKKVQ